MSRQLFTDQNSRMVRRYEYDDGWTVAAELGLDDDAVDVDVVDATAIVVATTSDGEREAEFDLPGTAASIDVHNGVLIIKGE